MILCDSVSNIKIIVFFHHLIATDVHLGYMEKDQVRGNDSIVTFQEVLEIAKTKAVSVLYLLIRFSALLNNSVDGLILSFCT